MANIVAAVAAAAAASGLPKAPSTAASSLNASGTGASIGMSRLGLAVPSGSASAQLPRDSAIISFAPRRYTRDQLFELRCSTLVRRRPAFIEEAIAARKSWCRYPDLQAAAAAAAAAAAQEAGQSGGDEQQQLLLATADEKKDRHKEAATAAAATTGAKDGGAKKTAASAAATATAAAKGAGATGAASASGAAAAAATTLSRFQRADAPDAAATPGGEKAPAGGKASGRDVAQGLRRSGWSAGKWGGEGGGASDMTDNFTAGCHENVWLLSRTESLQTYTSK